MFSSFQPSRPKLQIQNPLPPLNQQPARHFSTPSTFHPTSSPFYAGPRTQIEAMPPNLSPNTVPLLPRPNLSITPQAILDSSVRHPVFFTDRLVKAPTGVNAGNGSWGSPVAVGYVFNDGARRELDAARL